MLLHICVVPSIGFPKRFHSVCNSRFPLPSTLRSSGDSLQYAGVVS